MSAAAVMPPLVGTLPRRSYEEEEEVHAMELSDTKNDTMQDEQVSISSLANDVIFNDNMDDDDLMEERHSSYAGLVNIGNTCYLNAALQMLASLEDFPLLLANTRPKEESTLHNELLRVLEKLSTAEGETTVVNPQALKETIDSLSPNFVGYRQQDSHEFLTILLDLLDEAYKKSNEPMQEEEEEDANQDDVESEMTTSTGRSELDTLRLRPLTELQVEDIATLLYDKGPTTKVSDERFDKERVPQCKLIGGRAIPPLSGMTLPSSSSSVHNAEESATPLQDAASAADAPFSPERREDATTSTTTTPVDDYFFTQIRAQFTCNSCKHTRSHVETYSHLSLEMTSGGGSMEEGLKTFFAPTTLELKCEKCFCETATQTFAVMKLPKALLLHVKRFHVQVSPDYGSIVYRKNQSPLEFGNEISLADFQSEESQTTFQSCYSLRAVVNHIGSSASCGHYTADAIRRYPNHQNNEREWTRFNDSRVTQISAEQAMGEASQKTAYMIMYELEPSFEV